MFRRGGAAPESGQNQYIFVRGILASNCSSNIVSLILNLGGTQIQIILPTCGDAICVCVRLSSGMAFQILLTRIFVCSHMYTLYAHAYLDMHLDSNVQPLSFYTHIQTVCVFFGVRVCIYIHKIAILLTHGYTQDVKICIRVNLDVAQHCGL